MGIFDFFFGTILSGWLSDRDDNGDLAVMVYGPARPVACGFALQELFLLRLSLFCDVLGRDWIRRLPPTVRLTEQRFGPEARQYGLFGWIFCGSPAGRQRQRVRSRLARTVLAHICRTFSPPAPMCIVRGS